MADDIFRPRTEPARSIYDAFQAEASKRSRRTVEASVYMERQAVLKAARKAAEELGLRCPTMEDVERAERQAMGHVDYGAKWAYGVRDAMMRKEPNDG